MEFAETAQLTVPTSAETVLLEAVHSHVVITREKQRTIDFITKLYQLSNIARQAPTLMEGFIAPVVLPKVIINNTEAMFLDLVHKHIHNHLLQIKYGGNMNAALDSDALLEQADNNVLYYQMLYQVVTHTTAASGGAPASIETSKEPRSIVFTSQFILLCDEMIDRKEVQATVMEQITYRDIVSIQAEENPNYVTFVVKEPGKRKLFGNNKKKWQFFAPNRTVIDKLTMECRKLCQLNGNADVK